MTSPEKQGPPHYGMPMATEFYKAEDGETTFQYQDSLPSLPVPDLRSTLDKYLESVKPFVTDKEYETTAGVVDEFANGVGQTLQEKLQQKAANSRNWLADWWEDYGYLMGREPSSPLINFLGPAPYHRYPWPAKYGVQCERAALATWYTLKFWELLKKEEIRVDRGFGGTNWCMNQYRRIFSSCKTPGLLKDKLNYHFRTAKEGGVVTHIVVSCKGRLFTFKVVDDARHILTAPELQMQFQRVRDACEGKPWGPGLGILTSEHRVTWHKMRQRLIELHPDNARHLQTIESAIMLSVLDEKIAIGESEMSMEGFFGEGRNRWFDKGLTMVFLKNGLVTNNAEHACQDGMVTVTRSYWVTLGLQRCKGQWLGTKKVRPQPHPEELIFKVDDVITKSLDDAMISYQQRESNVDLLNRTFKPFGKKFIRKHKLHPDALIQVVIQCAYYRLYRKPAPTYETATTRKFYLGRTETIRSCTMEAINFSKAMIDQSVSPEKRLELMKIAMEKQIRQNTDCADFKGVDRHLLGLQILSQEEGIPLPEIYKDPAFTKSGGGGNFILSTSFVGYTPVFGGTAPMCENGYGIFYSIPNDWISFFITSWRRDVNTSSQRLYDAIEQTLVEAKDLLDKHGPAANL